MKHLRRIAVTLLFACCWLPANDLHAQDCLDYSLDYPALSPAGPRIYGPGDAFAAAAGDSLLCLASPSCVQVFGVADPPAPEFLGTLDLRAGCLCLHAGALYVGYESGGLDVVDVRHPGGPAVVASLPLPEGALDLVVRDDCLFVAMGEMISGLAVFDVSDPLLPLRRGSVNGPMGYAVAVGQTRAYLVAPSIDDDSSFVTAVAIDDLDAPQIIGTVGFTGRAMHADLVDDVLFVPTGTQGLRLFDVSSPAGAYPILDMAELAEGQDIVLNWPLGYATTQGADGVARVHTLDVSRPDSPSVLGSTALTGRDRGLAAADGWIFAATGVPDPELVDARNPFAPVRLDWNGSTGLPDLWAAGVATRGSLAYVGNNRVGASLLIYDMSDAKAPVLAGVVAGADRGGAVSIQDDLLFQIADPVESTPVNRLLVYSLAVPAAPELIGSLDLDSFQLYLNAGPGAVYLPINGAIHVIDVGDPTAPAYVGSVNPPGLGTTRHVAVADGVAYCSMRQDGVVTYDVTNPTDMKLLGGIDCGSAAEVAVHGDVAAVATELKEFVVLDVSDPVAPTVLARVPTDSTTVNVELDWPLAYICGQGGNVWIYDLSVPAAPVPIGRTQLLSAGYSVGLAGPWLVSASGSIGLGLAWRACPADWVVSVEMPQTGLALAAYPNPFNPAVTVSFSLPAAAMVNLEVHDLAGRRLTTLVSGTLGEGDHHLTWRGADASGRSLASGTYLLLLDADGRKSRQSVTLIR